MSVVVVLDNYYTADEPGDTQPPRIAKYARGKDYHTRHRTPSRTVGGLSSRQRSGLARTFADAGPVPERELAQRAGLGWIGKNTMLIRPDAGSFFFIGSVFTDLALEADSPFESRSLRQLHPVPGGLPHRRIGGAAGAGRHPLHLLPHHRAEGPDPGAAGRAARGLCIRVRHLQRACAPGISGLPNRAVAGIPAWRGLVPGAVGIFSSR